MKLFTLLLNKVRLLFCLMLVTPTFATQDLYHFSSLAQETRYQHLITEVRCVVCQGQSIADSNSLLAHDLRLKVFSMVNANQTDEEIKTYLVNRYGEFILYKPMLNKTTLFLWGFPVIALMGFSLIYATIFF